MLPAVAQGAIGLEIRSADGATRARLAPLACPTATAQVTAERALLAALDGNCTTPIAALARVEAERLSLDGLLAAPDGSAVHRTAIAGPVGEAARLGQAAGQRLLADAGPDFVIAR
jgi:hydroxymethylbilane synthase